MGDKTQEYRGKRIVVRFDATRCIHSRNCVLARPDVFVPNAPGGWIHPDDASPDAVAEIAHSCPSGAITYERLDSGSQEAAPKVNLVRIRENRPLAFHAELRVAGQVGAGFTASGEAATQESAALAQRDGTVVVKLAKNGPLLVEGNLEVVTGTGRTILRTRTSALCRCGGSANKPYCDGTHNKIGFTADAA
jgi:uncharacterized Fe-S cluster protein YjdI